MLKGGFIRISAILSGALVAGLLVAGCAGPDGPTTVAVAPVVGEAVVEPAARRANRLEADPTDEAAPVVRQGPLQVTCYKDDAVVFEHPDIYRIFRRHGENAGWSYETGDGLRFRGRIGEHVNCVWQRASAPGAPAGNDRP